MTAQVLDGKALAAKRREALKARVQSVTRALGRAPGLTVVLVGDDAGSQVYVRNKETAAKAAGIAGDVIRLPATASQQQVAELIDALNGRDEVDAMLVQLPLPKGLDGDALLQRIVPAKDADGLHAENLGRLALGQPAPRACTPSGVMALLDEAKVELAGAHAVVIGRSGIVGKPMALMLLERDATVTICHSRTRQLADEVRRADIVVAAVGRPGLVRGDWLKPGAVVIDVGINRVGDKLAGDVDYASASLVARAITPVPGGVGPMTIAMLLENTVLAAETRARALHRLT